MGNSGPGQVEGGFCDPGKISDNHCETNCLFINFVNVAETGYSGYHMVARQGLGK